jgi:FkbM family methyltransferase
MSKTLQSARPRDPESSRINLLGDGAVAAFKAAVLKRVGRSPLGWRLNFSVDAQVGTASVKIPLLLGRGYQNLHVGETWLYRAFAKVLAGRDGAFVDVGINLGQTLIKVKLIDRNRAYYGFEPNPQCAQYVSELISINRFADCTVVPVGLSDRAGVVTLWAKADAVDPSGSLVQGFRSVERYSRRQHVPVFSGDELLRDVERIALVKIDVEGGEVEVIRGLVETVRRCMPIVFCEVLPVFDENTDNGMFRKGRQEQFVATLQGLGYRMFRMLADDTIVELTAIETHADLSLTNYAFVPPAEHAAFRGLFKMSAQSALA